MNFRFSLGMLLMAFAVIFMSCDKEDEPGDFFGSETSEPMLIVRFKLDDNQLNSTNGLIPFGYAAQTPDYNLISANYIEFTSEKNAKPGSGLIAYKAPETTMGGDTAIDFSQLKIAKKDENFIAIPIRKLKTGTYNSVNFSIAYQNYNIYVRVNGKDQKATIAGFTASKTYIATYEIGNNIFPVNANKSQGYWALALDDYPYQAKGQIENSKPEFGNSTIYKSANFEKPLTITGKENSNVEVTLSLNIANSLQWKEVVKDGRFEPSIGETISNIGSNVVVPSFQKILF